MLVTPYPVSSAWSKPQQDEDTMSAQHCSTSSYLLCSDMIDIQTTLSETFTPHSTLLQPPPHPSSTSSTTSTTTSTSSNNNSDYFSQHFENVMESVPSPTTNISPDPGRGQEDNEDLVTGSGSLKQR